MSKLEQAINCSDGDQAAKIIQDALGIESADVAHYVFSKTWPADREQRARIIGEWLQTEARFLASPQVKQPMRQGRKAPVMISADAKEDCGSRAKGCARPNSDWDVVAFHTDAPRNSRDAIYRATQIKEHSPIGKIELVILHPAHWDDPRRYFCDLRKFGIRLR